MKSTISYDQYWTLQKALPPKPTISREDDSLLKPEWVELRKAIQQAAVEKRRG